MSHPQAERHPFLDDLTTDAELNSSVLRSPVTGRNHIRQVVNAVGTFYASQTPTYVQNVGNGGPAPRLYWRRGRSTKMHGTRRCSR
jgi:hypothetical protein